MTPYSHSATPDLKARLKQAYLALEKMEALLAQKNASASEPIAVVGMGCRFPEADSPEEYWKLLIDGKNIIREVPADRWAIDDYYDPDPEAPGKMYTRHGGFIDAPYDFDPHFFNITPREAVRIDPQHRLLLEVAWEALEHAGISPATLNGTATGIFTGLSTFDYSGMHFKARRPEEIDAYFVTGNYPSMAAGRLAYTLGAKGPSLSVDTACSSALVAIHLAVQSLRRQECRMALAGGVNLILSPELTINFCKNRMLSPQGRCYTFDDRADGYIRGEGCGMVVLKRLADAQEDQDTILALIKGTAVNHDGASAGLTVPNGPAQEAVIRSALGQSDLTPQAVGYLEAHGTGTALGDPIEMEAITQLFGHDRQSPLYVGSVKTNLGHTEAAAGIAGLIKTVLAVQHSQIPAHLNFETPSSKIEWNRASVRIPTVSLPWHKNGTPRTAGVSAFGASGTNAHVIVQEYCPPAVTADNANVDLPLHILTLSAKSPQALKALVTDFHTFLTEHPQTAPGDLCFTANTGRVHHNHRIALTAATVPECLEQLKAVNNLAAATEPVKPVFLFTGQGAQYPHMGKWLFDHEPVFKKAILRCHEGLRPHLGHPLLTVLFPESAQEQNLIHQTACTQPALFAFEYALARLLASWGITPEAVMGHSVGEYAAACIAGIFSLEDGLALIAKRAALMGALPDGGSMTAVLAPPEKIAQVIRPFDRQIAIAAINGPQSTVISGHLESLDAITNLLSKQNITTIPLTVSHAFHSPLMDPILKAFKATAATLTYHAPKLPIIANVTGKPFSDAPIFDPAGWADYWTTHIRQPVQFEAGLQSLNATGHTFFIEIGPRPVLSGMGRHILTDPRVIFLPMLQPSPEEAPQSLFKAIGTCYTAGMPVNWQQIYKGRRYKKIHLPTYPFSRSRYRFRTHPHLPSDSRQGSGFSGRSPLLGAPLEEAETGKIRFESLISSHAPRFLGDHIIHATIILPATGYLDMALTAAREALQGPDAIVLSDITIRQPMYFTDRSVRQTQLIIGPPSPEPRRFQIYSRTAGQSQSAQWEYHIDGILAEFSGLPQTAAVSPEALKAKCPNPFPVERLYAAYDACGLTLGPAFKAVDQLFTGQNESLGHITAPQVLAADKGSYLMHPALLDACFQSAGTFFLDYLNNFNYLPVSVGKILFYSPLTEDLWCRATRHDRTPPGRQTSAPATLSIDFTIFTPSGHVLVEVEGLIFRRTDRQAILKNLPAASRSRDTLHYQVTWRLSDEVLPQTSYHPHQCQWVIIAHREAAAKALANGLNGQNHQSRSVLTDTGYLVDAANARYILDASSPGQIYQFIHQTAPAADIPWRIVLVLPERRDFPDAATDGCLLMLTLAQAMLSLDHPPQLWLITQKAHAVGLNGDPKNSTALHPVNPSQTALWAFIASFALEHPEMTISLVDIDDMGNASSVAALLSLMKAESTNRRIALRDGNRFSPRITEVPERQSPPKSRPRSDQVSKIFNPSETYLITGGSGGLGMHLVPWMVTGGARHLVLCGRRPPSTENRLMFDTLKEKGVQIVFIQADVAESRDVKRLFAIIKRDLPPLKGIIHAAGVLADKLIANMTAEDLKVVMRPKTAGAWNLHEASRTCDLDFFILFSSMTAWLGAQGQANYAAANSFMNGLASLRHSMDLPALSINWGPWAGSGMAVSSASANKARMKRLGMTLLDPDKALNRLADMISPQNSGNRTAETALIDIDWSRYLKALYPSASPPFFEAVPKAAKRPNAPATLKERGQLMTRLQNTVEGQRHDLLSLHVQGRIADIMQLDDKSRLQPRQRLFDAGMDSLMAVELKNRLEADLDHKLTATLVFDYPTLETIIDYLENEILPSDIFESPVPEAIHRPLSNSDLEIPENLDESQLKELLTRELEEIAIEMQNG